VVSIGVSLLKTLKVIHDAGYIFNDLKPDNILLNYQEKSLSSLNLVDFGFSTKYLEKEGDHRKQTILKSFRGKMLFASLNQLDFK
jgi:serine/threonine protein kinase